MKLRLQNPRCRRLALLGLAAMLLGTTGCATNPATGKSQLSLYSEAQEVQIGRSNDQQIVAQFGLYDDADLAAYVDGVGRALAAASERPELPWTFRVLDDPVINAFALPGGFIYVTRGILSHMSSEAELAAVLGHEVGHVTARHGVSRMSKAQLATLGLGVGTVLAPELARDFGGLAQSGMQMLFLKYGRDDERQADGLGYRYADRVGHHPEGFVDMFAMLSGSSELQGGTRLPGYLQTHPEPQERLHTARQRLASATPEALDRPTHRNAFLDRLEGMPFGADPREGYFVGNAFVHPELRFRLELPEGWTGYNQKQALVAASPKKDAIVQLTLTGESTTDAAARAFYNQQGISVRSDWSGGGDAPRLEASRRFEATSGERVLYGSAAFAADGERVYRLLAVVEPSAWQSRGSEVEASLGSFTRLTERRHLEVEPMRMTVVTLDREMSLEEFERRYPSSISQQRLALINHVQVDALLPQGMRVKRVTGFDPGPQMDVELRRP